MIVVLTIFAFVFWLSVGWRVRRIPVSLLARERSGLATVVSIVFMAIWILLFALVGYVYDHLRLGPL